MTYILVLRCQVKFRFFFFFKLKGAIYNIISLLHVHLNNPALYTSLTASGVVSTKPPMSKQEYNKYNATITILWIKSSDEVSP